MLHRHDAVPHFTVRADAGSTVAYSSIWQQRHLVLIALPDGPSRDTADYISRVTERLEGAMRDDTTLVITRDPVTGLPTPGVLVADRWGEIAEVFHGSRIADLPSPEDLLEWIEHVRQRCPECEGETR
jgi:hypothetical protein